MAIISKIRRQGGAAVITLPPAVLKSLRLEVGSEVTLTVSDGELVARPAKENRKRYSMRELLSGSEAMAALNAETAWAREGDPVGREIS